MRNGLGHARGAQLPQWLSGRRGYVLLISMGLLGLLAMLGTTFVLLARGEQEASANFVDQVRARMIAFSGLEQALGFVAQADRTHPWSGHGNATFTDKGVGVVPGGDTMLMGGYNPVNISSKPGDDPGGNDHWFYGELFKVPTAVSSATERPYGKGLPQPGRSVGGLAPAVDVSFQSGVAKNDLGQDVGYSSDPNLIRGTYTSIGQDPLNPGDFYTLKVLDCASRLFVNDSNRNGRMTMMLNTLGGELSPPYAPGLGTKLMAAAAVGPRNAITDLPTKPYLSEGDLVARSGIPQSVMDQIRDFVTFHAWQDPNVIMIPFTFAGRLTGNGAPVASGLGPLDPRAPININTAPKEVLVAALNGLTAVYHQHVPGGPNDLNNPINGPAPLGVTTSLFDQGNIVTVTINIATAKAVAEHIIKCRYYYAGGAAVISYPHVDWMHVFQDTFDTAPGLTQDQSDLLRAAFCPNTCIKKWNPDVILVDPDISGRVDFTLLDKTDITAMTTEFCFGSMGHYDVESTGMVWDKNRRCIASCTLRTAVKTYDVLRLTTQRQFESYRMFDLAKEKPAPTPPVSAARLVSCVTVPEYPCNRPYAAYAPGSDMGNGYDLSPAGTPFLNPANYWGAQYDGAIMLNGWIDHRATTNSLLYGFSNGSYDAINGPAGYIAAPIPGTSWGYGYDGSPGDTLSWDPLPVLVPTASNTMAMLPNAMPSGVAYPGDPAWKNPPYSSHGVPQTWRAFYTTTQLHPFGMFFDSEFNRTGEYDGWPSATMGTPRMMLIDNVNLVKSKNCTVELWFKPLVDLVGVSGWQERAQCLMDTQRGPGADYFRLSIYNRQVQAYLYTETKGTPVNMIGDLTARTTGPKAWLPHTWHHIEFNWDANGGGVAQLYVDGDKMTSVSAPSGDYPAITDFDPTEGDTQPTFGFGPPPTTTTGSLKIGVRGDRTFDNGDPSDRIYCAPYNGSDTDSTSPNYLRQCLMGTIDNVCMHDKILHTAAFPSRSRYHDVSTQNSAYNYTFKKSDPAATELVPDTDVSGNHGLYQRRLQEIMSAVTANGQATIFNISCTHFHPPHEHSSGDHQPGLSAMGTTLALGHVSMALKRDNTYFEFGYDGCAGTPTLEAPATWMTLAPGQDLRLLVKLEIAENSQIPHNVGPIVDDITIIYSHGPKTLQFERVNE